MAQFYAFSPVPRVAPFTHYFSVATFSRSLFISNSFMLIFFLFLHFPCSYLIQNPVRNNVMITFLGGGCGSRRSSAAKLFIALHRAKILMILLMSFGYNSLQWTAFHMLEHVPSPSYRLAADVTTSFHVSLSVFRFCTLIPLVRYTQRASMSSTEDFSEMLEIIFRFRLFRYARRPTSCIT